MKKEFLEFLNTPEVEVPNSVKENIFQKLKHDFIPLNPYRLVSKFVFLNFAAGLITLSICPQFGIGPLSKGHDITHFFMGIGVWACAIFCAVFYFAIAQTLALLILTNRETRWIAQRRFSVLPVLVLATYFILMLVGKLTNGAVADLESFQIEFQVIWVLAALIVTQISLNTFSFKLNRF